MTEPQGPTTARIEPAHIVYAAAHRKPILAMIVEYGRQEAAEARAAAPPDIDVEPTMQDYLRWRDSLPMGDAYQAFLAGFRFRRLASPDAK